MTVGANIKLNRDHNTKRRPCTCRKRTAVSAPIPIPGKKEFSVVPQGCLSDPTKAAVGDGRGASLDSDPRRGKFYPVGKAL